MRARVGFDDVLENELQPGLDVLLPARNDAQLVAEMLALNPTLTDQQAREAVQRRLYGADSVPAIALPSSDGASAATADVQATALNGAQVAALVEIALKVATGELPRDSAKAIARAAFPLVSEELIDAIFDSIIPKPPAEEQPQEEEKAAA